MITIKFSEIDLLPNAILHSKGEVSRAFLDIGITTFHQAAKYIHQLPYGYNDTSENSIILFKDGFGTCTTKHGIIARLAEEMELPVYRYEGFYALTDEIVTGVKDILGEYGLPYIPRTHCFLSYENLYIDLTEGNCTGKNRIVENYLDIFKVKSEQSQKEVDEFYRDYYIKLCATDPCFARVGKDGMLAALERCRKLNAALCQIP